MALRLLSSYLGPALLASVYLSISCSAGDGASDGAPDGASSTPSPSEGSSVISGSNLTTSDPETAPPVEIITSLPEGFTTADADSPETSRGGFQVVGALADVTAPEGECANILRVIVRDFEASHDDFDSAPDWSAYEVLSPIGEGRKPEKTSDNGPLHLEEWYQNLDGVNLPFAVDLWLEPVDGKYVFDSTMFLPIKDVGYLDWYLFTTELHTNFEYQGGEVFTFRGDDDVFVFINGHLAVNLSGVHDAQEGSVDLDAEAAAFGLEVGGVYTFDLFQAERQPIGSNFRLETTLAFTGCGEILPSDVIR